MAEIGDKLSCMTTNWIDGMVSCLLFLFLQEEYYQVECLLTQPWIWENASAAFGAGITSYTLISHDSNSLPCPTVRPEVKRMHLLPIY